MEGCACFWVEVTDRGQRWLWVREDGECSSSPWGSHQARVRVGSAKLVESPGGGYVGNFDPPPDVSWPTVCGWCGYAFTDAANRMGNVDRIYIDGAGAEYTLRGPNGEGGQGPPGMMFNQDWYSGNVGDRYGDGINLTAVCPDGSIWNVDGPAYNDGKQTPNAWTRTGDPRVPGSVTVSPSIVAGDTYHGWLQHGAFTAG